MRVNKDIIKAACLITTTSLIAETAFALNAQHKIDYILEKGIIPYQEREEKEKVKESELVLMGTLITDKGKYAIVYDKKQKKMFKAKEGENIESFLLEKVEKKKALLKDSSNKTLELRVFAKEAEEIRKKLPETPSVIAKSAPPPPQKPLQQTSNSKKATKKGQSKPPFARSSAKTTQKSNPKTKASSFVEMLRKARQNSRNKGTNPFLELLKRLRQKNSP